MNNTISPFTLIDIQLISVGGELSDTLTIRVGELNKYITLAEATGKAVLMTTEPGVLQTDVLEFLELSEKV
ncbi:hypothetical protein N9C44_00845 [bacterium]|nr:hypothetical protein [bacterium]